MSQVVFLKQFCRNSLSFRFANWCSMCSYSLIRQMVSVKTVTDH